MQEMLERILVDFVKTPGIIAAGIMDQDGLLIAAHAPNMEQDEAEGAGGIITQLLNTAREVSETANMGDVTKVTSEAENGNMMILNTGQVFFGFYTEPNVNLGYVRMQAKKTADKINSTV